MSASARNRSGRRLDTTTVVVVTSANETRMYHFLRQAACATSFSVYFRPGITKLPWSQWRPQRQSSTNAAPIGSPGGGSRDEADRPEVVVRERVLAVQLDRSRHSHPEPTTTECQPVLVSKGRQIDIA